MNTLEYKGPHLFGEEQARNNEGVYAALPITPYDMHLGRHPLTQPGVQVNYYRDYQSAESEAFACTGEVEKAHFAPLQMAIVARFADENVVHNRETEVSNKVGTGPVQRLEVQELFMTIHNIDSNESHTFDITGIQNCNLIADILWMKQLYPEIQSERTYTPEQIQTIIDSVKAVEHANQQPEPMQTFQHDAPEHRGYDDDSISTDDALSADDLTEH